jgi:hypothetical protein
MRLDGLLAEGTPTQMRVEVEGAEPKRLLGGTVATRRGLALPRKPEPKTSSRFSTGNRSWSETGNVARKNPKCGISYELIISLWCFCDKAEKEFRERENIYPEAAQPFSYRQGKPNGTPDYVKSG